MRHQGTGRFKVHTGQNLFRQNEKRLSRIMKQCHACVGMLGWIVLAWGLECMRMVSKFIEIGLA